MSPLEDLVTTNGLVFQPIIKTLEEILITSSNITEPKIIGQTGPNLQNVPCQMAMIKLCSQSLEAATVDRIIVEEATLTTNFLYEIGTRVLLRCMELTSLNILLETARSMVAEVSDTVSLIEIASKSLNLAKEHTTKENRPVLETLSISYHELDYIKAIATAACALNEYAAGKEHNVIENTGILELINQARKNENQNATISLCKRICDSQNINFENVMEKVRLLHSQEDAFPEANGLAKVMQLSSLDATSIISYIYADDFTLQSSMTFILPTEQADSITTRDTSECIAIETYKLGKVQSDLVNTRPLKTKITQQPISYEQEDKLDSSTPLDKDLIQNGEPVIELVNDQEGTLATYTESQIDESIRGIITSPQAPPETATETKVEGTKYKLLDTPSILRSSQGENIRGHDDETCVYEDPSDGIAAQPKHEYAYVDVSSSLKVAPTDTIVTMAEAQSELLAVTKDEKIDSTYLIDEDKPMQKATPFEKVKSFLFGKPKKQTNLKAKIEPTQKILSSAEVCSEPDITQVKPLSKDEIKEDVAIDVSTEERLQEPISIEECAFATGDSVVTIPHNAIRKITEAVHEGRSMTEIQHSINVGTLPNPLSENSEKALVRLANEICALKGLDDTNVIQETSSIKDSVDIGVAALVRAVEKTAIECDEICLLIDELKCYQQQPHETKPQAGYVEVESYDGVNVTIHEDGILMDDAEPIVKHKKKGYTTIQPIEIISESNYSEAIESSYLVQSPMESPTFGEIIIKVTDAVSEGKAVTDIQTAFCVEEINVLQEKESQAKLRCLIDRICEPSGSEQLILDEILEPLDDFDNKLGLFKCFVSVLEQFAIERDQMLLLLKENEFECDPHSKDDKLEVADNICYESCEVASEQFIGSTAPVKKGDQGTRIVPGNVPYLENISMASETCPSAKNTPTWKMCKTIVSTIAEKVKDGLEVQAILLFIKEKILHEFRLDDLDQPIQQITKIICHAKGISEERVFENIQAHKIQNRIDAIIIPLIMAIELASIECGETIPILNATMHGIGTDQQGLPEQEQNLSFEEENAMTIQFQQELSANTEVPVFSAKKENIIAQHFSTTSKEPKVFCMVSYTFNYAKAKFYYQISVHYHPLFDLIF